MSGEKQIWKIQRPLYTTGSYTNILIYNEDHSVEGQVDVPQEWIDQYFGSAFKIYVKGHQNEQGQIVFEKKDILSIHQHPEW